jgi:FkbM family methyltransferase
MEPRLTADLGLKKGDLVWDVGGFEGAWSSDVFERYAVRPVIFEPIPAFAARILGAGFNVERFGLSDRDQDVEITVAGDRSSTFEMGHVGTGKVKIRLMDAQAVLGDQIVSVMKLNVEGAEYAILDRLITSGKLCQIGTLVVQFHTFIPDFGEKYLAIKRGLNLTHSLTWREPFIWERWDRR